MTGRYYMVATNVFTYDTWLADQACNVIDIIEAPDLNQKPLFSNMTKMAFPDNFDYIYDFVAYRISPNWIFGIFIGYCYYAYAYITSLIAAI